MVISYDVFTGAFLAKITEFDLLTLSENNTQIIVDGYMKRAISSFQHICKCDLITSADDTNREFDVELSDEDELTELIDIISEGMVVQWLKPYVNRQENLELVMNTRDYTTYSSAELLYRIGEAYKRTNSGFIAMMREYSFNHGDLTDLHL
jgi:hypothetical protein